MAKIKISPKTNLLQSEVGFGIKGVVKNSSVTLKEGESKKNGNPYAFAEFSVESHDHKLKIKGGGSKPEYIYVYDYDAQETEKIAYKKDYVSKKAKASLIGVKYETNGQKENTKCDFDFATSIKDIVVDGTYEIYGKIEFRRFADDKGEMKSTKELKVGRMNTTKSEEELHHFDIKNFLFLRVTDNKYKGKMIQKNGIAEGYILGYNEITLVRLYIGDEGLGETLANPKIVKPYTLMTVIGEISNKPEVAEAPKTKTTLKGNWGEVKTKDGAVSSYGMAKSFSFMKMTILKVDPSTLLHGKVTKELLQEAINKTNAVDDQYTNATVKNAEWGAKNKTPKLDDTKPTETDEVEEAVIVETEQPETKVEEVETEVAVEDEEDDFDFDDE